MRKILGNQPLELLCNCFQWFPIFLLTLVRDEKLISIDSLVVKK